MSAPLGPLRPLGPLGAGVAGAFSLEAELPPAPVAGGLKRNGTIVVDGVIFTLRGTLTNALGEKVTINPTSLADKWVLQEANEFVQKIITNLRPKVGGGGYANVTKLTVKMDGGIPLAQVILKDARADDEEDAKRGVAGAAAPLRKDHSWTFGDPESHQERSISNCFAQVSEAAARGKAWRERIEKADAEAAEAAEAAGEVDVGEAFDDFHIGDRTDINALLVKDKDRLAYKPCLWMIQITGRYRAKAIDVQGQTFQDQARLCCVRKNNVIAHLDRDSAFKEAGLKNQREVVYGLVDFYKDQKEKLQRAKDWNAADDPKGGKNSNISKINEKWEDELDQLLSRLNELDTFAEKSAAENEREDKGGASVAGDAPHAPARLPRYDIDL